MAAASIEQRAWRQKSVAAYQMISKQNTRVSENQIALQCKMWGRTYWSGSSCYLILWSADVLLAYALVV